MTASALPAPSLIDHVRVHVAELVRLAAPVIVSRVGLMVMMAVDAAIVGRYGARELAYYGLGHLPASFMVQTGVGLLLGTVAMTAQAVGAGRPEECGRVLRRALPYALLIGLIMTVLSLFGRPLFLAAGQAPDMAEHGAAVLSVLGYGLPAMALYVALGFFLEGLKRPVPGMLVMIAGNIVNAGLAWILVWGWGPVPAMGAVGSAWATTAVRWLMAIALLLYVWNLHDRDRWNVRGGFRGWWREGGAQRRFGYAAGLSLAVESLAFGGLGLIAGLIDPLAVAAYTVTLNLIALPFMAAVGVASATAVRVAMGFGRRDSAEMALAGWTGLGVTSVFLALVGVAYALFPAPIAGIYSADPALIERVAPLVAFSALVLVADGGQTVMGNALRGRNDSWVPTALHFLSYAVVMIPVSAFLALGMGRGERGLVEGILVASVVSVTILAGRFAWLCRR